MVELKIFP